MEIFYVKRCMLSTTKYGKPFADVLLVDLQGSELSCYVWDVSVNFQGAVIGSLLRPVVNSSGFSSLRASDIVACNYYTLSTLPEELAIFRDCFPKIPSRDQFCGLVHTLLDSYREDIRYGAFIVRLLDNVLDSVYAAYARSTAAKKYHHAYPGGLAQHIYEMLSMYSSIRPSLPFTVDDVLCVSGILFHDWGKIDEYTPDGDLLETAILTPHSVRSAELVYVNFSSVLDRRDMELLQHIIYSHHGSFDAGAPCLPSTIEAVVVSSLDSLSSFGDALMQTPSMGYVSMLQRKCVKS